MSKQLGLMMVREKVINRNQLEEATNQALNQNSSLIPMLLDMGVIDDADLSVFISEHLKVPLADRASFESIPDNIIRSVARDLADEFDLIPVGFEKNTLKLAMLDPTDQATLSELKFFLGKRISPMVASQRMIHEALDRYYHLNRKKITRKKIKVVPKKVPLATPIAKEEKKKKTVSPLPSDPFSTPEETKATTFESTAYSSIDAKPTPKPPPKPQVKPPPPLPKAPSPTPFQSKIAGHPDIGLLHKRTLTVLEQARDKDQIAEHFLSFAGKILRRVALFTIKKNVLLGWMGYGENFDPKNIKGIMIPLNSPSIFQRVRDSKVYYFGEVPNNSVNQIFLTALGGIHPQNVILIPIMVRDKVVSIFYADQAPDAIESENLHYLHLLVPKIASCLESLILKMKVVKSKSQKA